MNEFIQHGYTPHHQLFADFNLMCEIMGLPFTLVTFSRHFGQKGSKMPLITKQNVIWKKLSEST